MQNMELVRIVLCAGSLFLSVKSGSSEKTPLHVLGLYPFSGDWAGGESMLPATRLGFEHVNNNREILPNYEIKLVVKDTECDGGKAVDEMYRALYNRTRTFVMVLGCGCSKSTEPTAQSSHYWNLIQLSYLASSPRLSNRMTFPLLFRMYPSETVFNVVKFALLKHYGWGKVATLHQHFDLFAIDFLFRKPTSDFQFRASEHGIEIIAAESVSQDPSIQLANLKVRKVRIIIGNFYESMARKVFCEAYKLGMYGENYVWIITGWYTKFWWKTDLGDTDCSLEQMRKAVEGYFSVESLAVNLSPDPGLANISTSEFWSIYKDYVGGEYEGLPGYFYAPLAYDSAWVIAGTLHEAEEIIKNKDSTLSIANFSYGNKEFAKVFLDLMNRTNFVGVSGRVQFNELGDRKGLMKVEQNQGGLETMVGFYDPSLPPEERLSLTNSVIWQGDGPPDDMLMVDEVVMSISTYLFFAVTSFSIAGIGIALFFLAFNIKYRKKRFIKMSSPNVNNLILFGGILAYVSLIPLGIDSSLVPVHVVDWMCKLKLWCLTTSFSVAFGAMFMKTWRVHRIFTKKSRQKTTIRDHRLYAMIAVLVIVNIILFVVWELSDPLHAVRELVSVKTSGRDVVRRLFVLKCVSESQVYFYGILFMLDGLLLIFGAFLAWETREVTVKALNDSKYIGMSIYTVVVLSFIAVPVTLVLDDADVNYALLSMFIFFATTLTLCLVFVPKVKARNMVEPKGVFLFTIAAVTMESQRNKRLNDRVNAMF